MMCCASCGAAQGDDIQLKKCTILLAISLALDIAASNAKKNIDHNTSERPRKEQLSHVMNFYVNSPKATIVEIWRLSNLLSAATARCTENY